MAKQSLTSMGLIQRGFWQEQYQSLCGKLQAYRVDTELNEARGTVLPFVTGLRFSALLIYRIRAMLNGTELKANWGTIIDDAGRTCSSECDIIVHEGRSVHAWNGDDDVGGPVMNFHFVHEDAVRAVISCKSFVKQIDARMKEDVQKLGDYAGRIWLFAECCNKSQVAALRTRALAAGYEKFLYLYLLTSGVRCAYDENVWLDFAQALGQLAQSGVLSKRKK